MDRPTRISFQIRSSRNRRITIPREVHHHLGITEQSVLELRVDGDALRIRVAEAGRSGESMRWLRDLYEMFEPARDEATARGHGEHEINDLIDTALSAVRDEQP
jgi:bifunctional DNA-binding transcriptional regulator/antitoxin component of YhaV-PrlF toxin-antitoxin module